jgi:hypothetical protein
VVKNKYHDYGPPWIISMNTNRIHGDRYNVYVYTITKIKRTTGTKNYGLIVLLIKEKNSRDHQVKRRK